jgi:hypothetical protein
VNTKCPWETSVLQWLTVHCCSLSIITPGHTRVVLLLIDPGRTFLQSTQRNRVLLYTWANGAFSVAPGWCANLMVPPRKIRFTPNLGRVGWKRDFSWIKLNFEKHNFLWGNVKIEIKNLHEAWSQNGKLVKDNGNTSFHSYSRESKQEASTLFTS